MGLFDDIAKIATSKPGSKEQKQAKDHIKHFSKSDTGKKQGYGSKETKQAVKDAVKVSKDEKTEGQIKSEKDPHWFKTTGIAGVDTGKKVVTDEKKVIPEEEITFFKGYGNVSPIESKLINKLRKRGLNDAAILMALKQAKFSDENLIDLMSGEGWKKLIGGVLDKSSFFEKPEYEHDFLGSAGAANIIKKLQGKPPNEQQAYIDQLIKANPKGFQEMFGDLATKVTPALAASSKSP